MTHKALNTNAQELSSHKHETITLGLHIDNWLVSSTPPPRFFDCPCQQMTTSKTLATIRSTTGRTGTIDFLFLHHLQFTARPTVFSAQALQPFSVRSPSLLSPCPYYTPSLWGSLYIQFWKLDHGSTGLNFLQRFSGFQCTFQNPLYSDIADEESIYEHP